MKQRLLAIETSSPRLSLALGTEAGLQRDYQGPLAWRHAESLFDGMQKLMRQAGWPIQSLTGVIVSLGPGSFTGIRIGMAVARALGQSLNIPVKGFSSLEALAQPLNRPGACVCPVIDGLRGEVFSAVFKTDIQGKTRKILKECRMPVAEWIETLRRQKQPLWVVGDAWSSSVKPLRAALGHRLRVAQPRYQFPRAAALLELGRGELQTLKGNSYQAVLPMYLRRAAAQERGQGR